MIEITDEVMRSRLAETQMYTLAILHLGPHRGDEGADAIIWEHGRRNMALNAEGVLPVVCPVNDGTGTAGIGIFAAPPRAGARDPRGRSRDRRGRPQLRSPSLPGLSRRYVARLIARSARAATGMCPTRP